MIFRQIMFEYSRKNRRGTGRIEGSSGESDYRRPDISGEILGYQEAGQIQIIRKYGQLLSEEYTPEGIEIKARVPRNIYGKIGGK